ncbi:MAG: phosphotriesterase-related protein [Chloroflexi bacterium]|nr:phosphotriesterase-related protein [Chloroflexota bacterium]
MSGARIQTVTGPIDATGLGVTLAHEHVLLDGWGMFGSYDAILDDEALAVEELGLLREAGGRAVVDCTTVGLGRDPAGLRRVSQASGITIVMGAGWYRRAVYPPMIVEQDADQLADHLVTELTVGADGTDVRAGFIGEIGTERYAISTAEERVFRAAARAQRRTGVAIWTHTTNGGDLAMEQVALLTSEGVPVDRIVVSHVGDRIGFERLADLAATGVYLSIDNIGYTSGGYPPDAVRVRNVVRLLEAGHGDRVLLSGDTCTRSMLTAYGGPGYGRVLTSFVPALRAAGVDEASIDRMLVTTPAQALAVPAPDRA